MTVPIAHGIESFGMQTSRWKSQAFATAVTVTADWMNIAMMETTGAPPRNARIARAGASECALTLQMSYREGVVVGSELLCTN